MMYLCNAFSLGMVESSWKGPVHIYPIDVKQALRLLDDGFNSCIGHANTAEILTNLLKVEVAFNRVSVSLKAGDEAIVAQYDGPRLPEGATSLPEGASFRWFLVRMH